MLTNHHWGLVEFTWRLFHRKCLRYLPLIWVENYEMKIMATSFSWPGANELKVWFCQGAFFYLHYNSMSRIITWYLFLLNDVPHLCFYFMEASFPKPMPFFVFLAFCFLTNDWFQSQTINSNQWIIFHVRHDEFWCPSALVIEVPASFILVITVIYNLLFLTRLKEIDKFEMMNFTR